jgi:hypothetical protein
VVKQLAPDRYEEFQRLYLTDKKGKAADFLTYSISDYLLGVRVKQHDQDMVDPFAVLSSKFQQQLNIFASRRARATAVISDIQGVLQAELLDDELEVAEELLSRHQIRAAGALAGVTLERHLGNVCSAHAIRFRKRNPRISDYNDALKDHDILDLPGWRQIQFLTDVRNACVHWRDKEPQQEQVEQMLAGVKRVIKQVF